MASLVGDYNPENKHGTHQTDQSGERISDHVTVPVFNNDLTYTGCNEAIPALEAIAPVINGIQADPAWPTPAIQPIEPVKSERGRILAVWFMTRG